MNADSSLATSQVTFAVHRPPQGHEFRWNVLERAAPARIGKPAARILVQAGARPELQGQPFRQPASGPVPIQKQDHGGCHGSQRLDDLRQRAAAVDRDVLAAHAEPLQCGQVAAALHDDGAGLSDLAQPVEGVLEPAQPLLVGWRAAQPQAPKAGTRRARASATLTPRTTTLLRLSLAPDSSSTSSRRTP